MVLALALVLAPRTGAAVYWATFVTNPSGPIPGAPGRANLDGTAATSSPFPAGVACGVAVDDEHVFWGGGQGIVKASHDGQDVEFDFMTVNAHCAVAVDDEHIYWLSGDHAIDASGIGRANIDGTGVQPNWITGLDAPRGMTVAGEHVYWVTADGSVGRANINGTQPEPAFVPGPGNQGTCGVAVDDAHIYWSNFWTGTIGRADLSGANVNQSFIVDPAPAVPGLTFCGLAVDGTHLYWDEYPGRIGRARTDGTNVEYSLVPAFGGIARGVAVDGRTVAGQAVATSPESSVYGEPITITATVSSTDTLVPSPPTPTGTVSFLLDGTASDGPVGLDGLGRGSLMPSEPLDVGATVTASYSGDGAYLPVVSELSPEIRAAATATGLSTSANPATAGGEVEVVVSVSNTETDVVPFGGVTFFIDGAQATDALELDDDGEVVVIVSDLPAGDFTVETRYRDDTASIPDFVDSSASYVQQVRAPTTGGALPPAAPNTGTPMVTLAPADTTKPHMTVTARATAPLKRSLRRGLPVTVTCSEPCVASVSAAIDRRTARRLGLGRSSAVVGQSQRPSQLAERHRVRVKFSRKAKRAMRNVSKLGLTLRARAADAADNVSVGRRKLRLQG